MLQQPLGGAGIKVGEAFPVEGVAGVVVEVEIGAGDF
jgi:hypothetical protein